MTSPRRPHILVLAGSSRSGALSLRLRDAAAATLAEAGASVEALDLRALALPVYDGDLEADSGVPDGAKAFRDALQRADGVLFVTPEYNGFPTPLTLNAWDWVSRVGAEGEAVSGTAATTDKPVALLSSSPGAFGGMRALALVRQFLSGTFQMLVLPQQMALGRAHEAFGADGALQDSRQSQTLAQISNALVTHAKRRV